VDLQPRSFSEGLGLFVWLELCAFWNHHALYPADPAFLTAPKLLTFIISLVLAVIAVLAIYGHFAPLRSIDGFLTLLIAWLILAAGVLIRGI
jgi:purine-cytosine permease-like protein